MRRNNFQRRKHKHWAKPDFGDMDQAGNRIGWLVLIVGGGLFLLYIIVAALNDTA